MSIDTAPYVPGSSTSERAAEAIEPFMTAQRWKVLTTFRQFGLLTDEDVAGITGLSASSVRPRRGELVELGYVIDSGEERKTKSGRAAVLWRVTTPEEREQILSARKAEREEKLDRVGELEELLGRCANVLEDGPLRELVVAALKRGGA